MRCPSCQHQNTAPVRFCAACGVELPRDPAGARSADRLASLGEAALDRGDRAAARAWFEESLTIALGVAGSDRVPRLLESFAALAASQSDYARALTLAGAAATVRDVTGAPPLDRPDGTVKWLARAYERLGEPAARWAWRIGREMSFDDAIEYALRTIVSS
jgi:hypothetical protein